MQRALPLWRERIEPDLRSGKTVLVVAHGNSLRGLVKHVDGADSVLNFKLRRRRLHETTPPWRRRRDSIFAQA